MKIGSVINVLRKTQCKIYRKGEIVIDKGETDATVVFIRKGLIRSFIQDDEKNDRITFQLYPEYQLAVNLHAILFQEPSKFTYQALEDTKTYQIDYHYWMQMASNNAGLFELNRNYMGRNVMKKAFQRAESFVFLSPEERYLNYIRAHPNLVNRVPDKYIAHVLGITPVSLSRIRHRIVAKKE